MKNTGINFEDDVLEWLKLEAIKRGMSVSRLVNNLCREALRKEK